MSKYLTFQEILFTSQELLLQALAKLGYDKPETGEALQLVGYRGDIRPETAQIVIRRKYVGSASNDLGFMKTDRGYVPLVSEYDQSAHPRFLADLRTRYSELVIAVVARRLGGTMRQVENGSTKKYEVQYA